MFWNDEDDFDDKPKGLLSGFFNRFDDEDEDDVETKILKQLIANGKVLQEIQKSLKRLERR